MNISGIVNSMDSVQTQVLALNHKVDALSQVVEEMNHKLSEALSANKPALIEEASASLSQPNVRQYSYQSHSRFESIMAHKDVLSDSNGFEKNSNQSSEKELSPEIQIQRLTAQLTAAYNRIAALEEQLLARRVHS